MPWSSRMARHHHSNIAELYLMGIVLKTPEEIEAMRVAGHLAGEVLRMIREHVVVGVTTGKLDDICHAYITEEQQAIPADQKPAHV